MSYLVPVACAVVFLAAAVLIARPLRPPVSDADGGSGGGSGGTNTSGTSDQQ